MRGLTKRCSGCCEVLPATPEHFHRQKNGLFGLTSKCKSCKAVQIEAWRQRNLEKQHSYKVKWRTENREAYLIGKRRNMHARRLATQGESFTAAEWSQLLEDFGYACLACGAMDDLTMDHIVPLALGGSNTIENLQPLCRSCNSGKGTNTWDYRQQVA